MCSCRVVEVSLPVVRRLKRTEHRTVKTERERSEERNRQQQVERAKIGIFVPSFDVDVGLLGAAVNVWHV